MMDTTRLKEQQEQQHLSVLYNCVQQQSGEIEGIFKDVPRYHRLFRTLVNVLLPEGERDERGLCLDWSKLDELVYDAAVSADPLSTSTNSHLQINESKSGDSSIYETAIFGKKGGNDRFIDALFHRIERGQQNHDRKWKKNSIIIKYWTQGEGDEKTDTSSDDDDDDRDCRVHCSISFDRAKFKKGGQEEERRFWEQAAALEAVYMVFLTNDRSGKSVTFVPDPDSRLEEMEKVRAFYNESTLSEIEVRELLKETLRPVLLDTQTKLGVPSPIYSYVRDLVQYEPDMTTIKAAMAGSELKSKVVAIAGESGSGKTRFAVDGLLPGLPRFYVLLEASDLADKPKPEPVNRAWHWLVLQAIAYFEGKNGTSEMVAVLDEMRSLLNRSRNEWAREVFLKALKRTSRKVEEWFTGVKKAEALPDDIVCIVDEAGKDIDFVNGMVDLAEPFFASKAKRVGRIRLVLCGTRLDAIKRTASGSFVGSNPNKTLIIDMKGTCLGALAQQISPNLVGAVRKGTYSRILATNVRILTKILLPFLDSSFVGFHTSAQTKESHQIQVGSHWVSMVFVPTAYFSLNGLSEIKDEERDKLLLDAFKFFAMKSISAAGAVVRPGSVAIDPANVDIEDDHDIFKRGLATSDASDSPAIKFLACDGLVCPVVKADGDSLEQALVLHLCRLLKVRSLNPCLYVLGGAWPPATSGMITSLWTDELDEYQLADITHIAELMESGSGIVLRQGARNAQGPDVMDLYPSNDSEWILDIYQSKNEDDPGTPGAYAETLGVRVLDDGSTLVADGMSGGEKVDKPYRAQKAIERFCEALKKAARQRVNINRRVLLWKGKWPKGNEKGYRLREVYESSPVELWPREFLSPSIDCFTCLDS